MPMDPDIKHFLDRIDEDSRRRDGEIHSRLDNIDKGIRGVHEILAQFARIEERQQADREQIAFLGRRIDGVDTRVGRIDERVNTLECKGESVRTEAKLRWQSSDQRMKRLMDWLVKASAGAVAALIANYFLGGGG